MGSTETMSTARGAFWFTPKLAHSSGSVEIAARPLANGLAAARNEEEQRHARVRKDVAQAVDAVIAAPVGNEQRLLVVDAHEARRIAARGAIEAVGACRGQREEWRRLDEGAVMGGDAH